MSRGRPAGWCPVCSCGNLAAGSIQVVWLPFEQRRQGEQRHTQRVTSIPICIGCLVDHAKAAPASLAGQHAELLSRVRHAALTAARQIVRERAS